MKKDILIIINKHISWESNNLYSSLGSFHISGPPISSPSITQAQTGIRLFLRALPLFSVYNIFTPADAQLLQHT